MCTLKASSYGAEKWLLMVDESDQRYERAFIIKNKHSGRLLAVQNGCFVGLTLYIEDRKMVLRIRTTLKTPKITVKIKANSFLCEYSSFKNDGSSIDGNIDNRNECIFLFVAKLESFPLEDFRFPVDWVAFLGLKEKNNPTLVRNKNL